MLFKVFFWLQCVSIGVLGMMETICLEDIGIIPRILCMLVFGMFFYWGRNGVKKNWKLYREKKSQNIRKEKPVEKVQKEYVAKRKSTSNKVAKGTAIAGGAVAYAGLRTIANLVRKY